MAQLASREEEDAARGPTLAREKTVGAQSAVRHLALQHCGKPICSDGRDELHCIVREESLCRSREVATDSSSSELHASGRSAAGMIQSRARCNVDSGRAEHDDTRVWENRGLL